MIEDKVQWLWLLSGIGVVIVALILIYFWGIRARFQNEPRKRRLRPGLQNEPKLGEPSAHSPEEEVEVHDFGDLGLITPDHHLADKALVDVEIRPLSRESDFKSEWFSDRSPPAADAHSFSSKTRDAQSPDWSTELPPALPEHTHESSESAALAPAAEITIALTVMAPQHLPFKGVDIQAAAEDAQLRLSPTGLFERFPDGKADTDMPVFSLAHLRKPGSFQPETLAELTTPGLLLFMKLPGPLADMTALDLLVLAADQLARRLKGMICDEHRVRMTNRGLLTLRNKVAELERPQSQAQDPP